MSREPSPRRDPEASRPPATRKGFTAVLIVSAWVLALVRLALLIHNNAVDVPFQDQWDLLRPLFDERGAATAFIWQHGPHRQGLGGLVQWWLYRVTDWDVRAEAWAGVVALTIAAGLATAVAVRLRGRWHGIDVIFPLLLLSPVHWETLLLTPNVAHGVLPVMLTFALALGWAGPGTWRDVAVISIVGLLAQFTGFGFCALLASALLVATRTLHRSSEEWELRKVFVVGAAHLATVLLFLVHYRWDPAVPGWQFPVPNAWNYPRFVGLMFSSLLGLRSISLGSLWPGCAVALSVVGVAGWVLWRGRRRPVPPRDRVVLLLASTSLVFAAFTAVGRLPVNIEAAFMWRYLPMLIPGVAALALAIDRPAEVDWTWGRRWAMAAVLLIAGRIWGNLTPELYAAAIADGKRQWVTAYLKTHDMAAANNASNFYVMRADPESAVVQARLIWLEERHLSLFRAGSAVTPKSSGELSR